jgi:hypothetical protein
MLEQLEAAFNVERFEGYGLDRELEGDLARPSIRLVPRGPRAAPLGIAFTTFPGLKVRVGRWLAANFPACGCDACAATAQDEAARLAELVEALRAGRVREGVSLPVAGDGWQEWAYVLPSGQRYSNRSAVDRVRAREMLAGSERSSIAWGPWPRLCWLLVTSAGIQASRNQPSRRLR